jgi:hypothetical protein
MFSHHVNDGLDTSGQPALGSGVRQHPQLTNWDCVACHAEGDAVTGAITSYHIGATKTVDLRNADGSVTSYTDASGVYNDWPNLTPAARSEFCLSCHDADGATIISTRTDSDPDATTDPLNPYNDGVTNGHEPDGFDGTLAPHPRLRSPFGPTDLGVVDIKSRTDWTNAAVHVAKDPNDGSSQPAYGPSSYYGIAPYSTLSGAIKTPYTWESILECEDCHVGTDREGVDVKLSGHGTVNSRYMLRDASGDDAVGQYDGKNQVLTHVCFKCHDPITNNATVSIFSAHAGRDSDHQKDSNNIFAIGCLNCHGGGFDDGGYVEKWGAIHGVNEIRADNDGGGNHVPNVFTYGSALDLIDSWGTTPSASFNCSGVGASNMLNDCTQHGGRSHNRQNVSGPSRYRIP